MAVQNLIPTSYRRIKGRHTYNQPSAFNYMNWTSLFPNKTKLDYFSNFVYGIKRRESLDLASAKLLLNDSKKADAISFIGNIFSIYQFKNSQIDAIRNKYYFIHPTSAKLKSPKIRPSIPSVVKKRIQELERLAVGWDSYSARPISARAIEVAISLLIRISSDLGRQLAEDVFIAPCSDGGVQLEWELNSKELIIKIAPDGKQLFFLLVSSSGEEKEGAITSKAELDSLLQEILYP